MTPALNTLRRAALWPLYSPLRLAAVAAAVLVLLVLVVVLSARTGTSGHNSGGGKGSSPAAPASPSPEAPSASPPPSEDLQAAMRTARDFVRAWSSHPKTHREWMRAMDPHLDILFRPDMATGDPDRIPAKKVTGWARPTQTGTPGETSAAVPTDAGPVSVHLTTSDGHTWQVTGIDPGAQPEPKDEKKPEGEPDKKPKPKPKSLHSEGR